MNKVIRLTILFAAPWYSGITAAQPAQQSEGAPSFASEAILNAPVAAVWKVWTSSEGYKLLGVALADVDFRIGGLIRPRYVPQAHWVMKRQSRIAFWHTSPNV